MNEMRAIVSICGPSGSGKSSVAKALVCELGAQFCVRIPGDLFLTPAQGTLDEYWRQPLRYDWVMLARVLTAPDGAVVGLPDFDFERFVRRSDSGGREVMLRRIRVVDALLPYPRADMTVRLFAPAECRRARIIARDAVWGSHVMKRWDALERAGATRNYSARPIDLELSGLREAHDSAALIAAWLNKPLR
jgi:uridine kinase